MLNTAVWLVSFFVFGGFALRLFTLLLETRALAQARAPARGPRFGKGPGRALGAAGFVSPVCCFCSCICRLYLYAASSFYLRQPPQVLCQAGSDRGISIVEGFGGSDGFRMQDKSAAGHIEYAQAATNL